MSGWTREMIEMLKALQAQNFSSTTIARALGGDITRNSVIGKLHRLGLRPNSDGAGETAGSLEGTASATVARSQPRPRVALAPKPVEKPVELVALRFEDGRQARLMDLTPHMCRWPHGDPQAPDFHFCGHPKIDRSPYCREHTADAWQGTQKRAVSAEQSARRDMLSAMRRAAR